MFRSIHIGKSRSPVRILCVASDDLARALRGHLKRLAATATTAPGFLGDNGETRVLDESTVLLGLGKRASVSAGTVRTAAARLLRTLDRMKAKSGLVILGDEALPRDANEAQLGRAFGEGLSTANWRVTSFDGAATNRSKAQGSLTINAMDRDFREGIAEGLAIGASVNYARELAATPPNVCTPAWVANEGRKLARSAGLRCRVISYGEAQRLGMGGLVNVGKGSLAKPCLLVLEWKPRSSTRSSKSVHVCLVGKTVTYDTGGYSLKVNNGMKGMKYDKCGGMAVLGAMHAIASAKLPVRVTALLPAAENMVSGDSYRPDDIISLYNGVTVEVTNTDAEGRLVLADALSWACETLKPSHIVDIATLTGGVVTALGSWCAGLMCNDADLRGRVERAGDASGDRVWHLPLWSEHRDHMRSQHADIVNSNPSRLGHPLQGGAFLSFFVDSKIPWAHVDIAGVASVESANDVCAVPGPTGFGVRLMFELVNAFA
ncbi:MAG: leucyl aminopeptidase family protein [Phycisphaerales bacterium]